MKLGTQRELEIEKLVFRGDGLGHDGGKAVFVPLVVPGDLITWEPLREKRRYIRGRLLEVVHPSPERVSPPCPLYGRCGGCQWQHLRYNAQLRWKRAIVREILSGVDGALRESVAEIIPSGRPYHYRARVRLAMGREGLGFYRAESHLLIPTRECPLLDERLNRILKALGEMIQGSPLAHVGRELLLEAGDHGAPRAVFRLHSFSRREQARLQAAWDKLAPLAETTPFSLWMEPSGGAPKLLAGEDQVILAPVGGKDVKLYVPPGGFFQANLEQNKRLTRLVTQALEAEGLLIPGVRALDLYCGMGNFSIPLAVSGADVTGVDSSAPSIEAARQNAAVNRTPNTRFVHADAASYLREIISGANPPPDVLLLDPPRTGAKELVETLVEAKTFPKVFIYISCDPMTLARDLKVLVKRAMYEIRSVTPLDMFPQTFHVETVTVLRKRQEKRG